MVKTPKNKMQELAAEIVKASGFDVEYGEYEFVSTATELLHSLIKPCYEEAGLNPPSLKTITNWLYKPKAPDLAMVLLIRCWNEKKSRAAAEGNFFVSSSPFREISVVK